MKLSATIITLNEEVNIGEALQSLCFLDEVIVVDSGSSDNTEAICRRFPNVRFILNQWPGYGRQKNFAAAAAANDWIINIDADERISEQLKLAIENIDTEKFCAFRVARENYFSGSHIKRCGWYPDFTKRVYNRTQCSFSEDLVHESLVCNGHTGTLSGNLIHYTYSDISDYLLRMNRYSTLAAQEMQRKGKGSLSGMSISVKAVFTFIKMFVIKLGFLDGYKGFMISVLYAFYTFSKYIKLNEIRAKENPR